MIKGVCIYEMLTGRRLFNRSDKDLYREQVLDDSLDLPSNLSSDVASLLINLLCKDVSRVKISHLADQEKG